MSWKAVPKQHLTASEPRARVFQAGGQKRNTGVRLSFNYACRAFLKPGPVVLLQDEKRLGIRPATSEDSAITVRPLTTYYQVSASRIAAVGQYFRVCPPDKDGIIVLEPV